VRIFTSAGTVFVADRLNNPDLLIMKRYLPMVLLLLFSFTATELYPQKFYLGAGSGTNFSDLHSTTTYGHWKSKPGPSAGIFAGWQMTPTLGLNAGVDYSTVYYEYHRYNQSYYPDGIYLMYSSIWIPPYISKMESANYSFVTLPLQLTVTIPTKPELTLGAGAYYSFNIDQDTDYGWYYYPDDSLRNDYGYTWMMRLDYPLLENIDMFVRGRYNTGRRFLTSLPDSKHGSTDLTVGLICRLGRAGDAGTGPRGDAEEDAEEINEDIYFTWRTGVNLSWNSGDILNEKYSSYTGPSAGFMMNFRISGSKTWFRTGLTLERQGYSMRDSSDLYYLYQDLGLTEDYDYYVDSRVSVDYAVIPLLLDFHFGGNETFSFSTGPYFAARLNARCTGTAMQTTNSNGSYTVEETTIHDDLTELIRRNDFGWLAGAGVAIPLHDNLKLDIGIEYRQGFSEVFNLASSGFPKPINSKDVFIRNSALTLRAGLRIPLYR
jgi:opacity protein-like surface antigen